MLRIGLSVAVVSAVLTGCVEREMHIREMHITSEPAGAIVSISGEEVGRTPLVHSFTWYGDYEITLRRDGYETLKTHADLNAPVYEWPGLDLLSELAPWTYRDVRYLHYDLEPFTPADPDKLLDRAVEMRNETLQEVR